MEKYINIKRMLLSCLCIIVATVAWADGTKTTYTFDIQRTLSQSTASVGNAKGSIILGKLNYADGNIMDAISNKNIRVFTVNSADKYAAPTSSTTTTQSKERVQMRLEDAIANTEKNYALDDNGLLQQYSSEVFRLGKEIDGFVKSDLKKLRNKLM